MSPVEIVDIVCLVMVANFAIGSTSPSTQRYENMNSMGLHGNLLLVQHK